MADVACWVIKTSAAPAQLVPGWAPGEERLLTRCLRRTYRLGLVRAGQPCLLWLSGRDRPGVQALGTVAADVVADAGGPTVRVRLQLLREPVPRAELLLDESFRSAEVVRMAAGSNPSWLSAGQFAAVLDRVPPSSLGPWQS